MVPPIRKAISIRSLSNEISIFPKARCVNRCRHTLLPVYDSLSDREDALMCVSVCAWFEYVASLNVKLCAIANVTWLGESTAHQHREREKMSQLLNDAACITWCNENCLIYLPRYGCALCWRCTLSTLHFEWITRTAWNLLWFEYRVMLIF